MSKMAAIRDVRRAVEGDPMAPAADSPQTSPRYVYLFDELDLAESAVGGDWDAVRALLGGKGANLGDMTRLGTPVPPGFTVTTEGCNAFLASGEEFPPGLWEQQLACLEAIEKATGRRFGDPSEPLLVSCRSGSKFSMPGMMDTILNLGLDAQVAEGMVARGHDPRFVYDLYRRLVQMFGSVVQGVPDHVFELVIEKRREEAGVNTDTELSGDDWRDVTARFQEIVQTYTGEEFPSDPLEQLRLATEAVFRSWNGRRAIDYRNAAGIAHDLGTAVNVQTMVFGNMGEGSATGVFMSRNASTGERELEGDFLMNAQGEDVVAGIRATQPLQELEAELPEAYRQLAEIAGRLESHYRNMQDMEFTVERGRLWLLQTRDGKRTAQAEVRIAVDMAEEGLISREEAVLRVQPEQVDFFLHPQLEAEALKGCKAIARGLNVSPGAAVGIIAFDADTAERWSGEGKDVIMVRPETKPDDVHGMLASKGILTARGGRTSHAALVARQFGKPAVVGVAEIHIDVEQREMSVGEDVLKEGDWLSLDGTHGTVYAGQLPTVVPDLKNPYLLKVLSWADEFRRLGIRANADYERDANRALINGAEGIGLCRTEHMFFEPERLGIVQRMILAKLPSERQDAIAELLPVQRDDFASLFRAMDGLPVIIRLLDPPLHEFLPSYDELIQDLADLKVQLQHMHTMSEIDEALEEIRTKQDFLERVTSLRESNPMLGTRGVRLGIQIPELTRMQVRAIIEAACQCVREGIDVKPEVMIPLTSHVNELEQQREALEEEARAVLEEQHLQVPYRFGTMIEVPRAALTADQLARTAEFFSFGTNDLTQTTFGMSRDDAESGFLLQYINQGILPTNPFTSIDPDGVGKLIETAIALGRSVRPDLPVGICGEHGGDPESIALCHRLGLDYVSCSPFRVPIARLAAAHAALTSQGE
jgi:pyruvate,orthophosphate dikinase